MRILLTGSRGYIGTVMAPFLLDAGQEGVGVATDLYRRSTFGPWRESIRTLCKDVREIQLADLRGFDAVIHLAALSNDPLGDLNPLLTYEINHLASVRLAQQAKAAGGRRFVFPSSSSNYGARGGRTPPTGGGRLPGDTVPRVQKRGAGGRGRPRASPLFTP